jgi:methylase of polypeptide subunit release factors
MKSTFKYLSQHCSTNPKEVDRLIISAFLSINNLIPLNNNLLKSYFIDGEDGEELNKLDELISNIKIDKSNFGFEELIELFEFVISPADRIINGAIYTPDYIRTFIIDETLGKMQEIENTLKISDIACGCGGFLFNASIELNKKTNRTYQEIFASNIFGLDIQDYSVTRTKLLLSLLGLANGEDPEAYEFNIFQGDSLEFNWFENINNFEGFSIILGNPPYVCARNLDKKTKDSLKKWEVCQTGNSDLYIPFFQIAVENLSQNGILGFITMNSFFKSLNGRDLRAYFQRKQLGFTIIDFGAEQVFKSKNTYTCICLIENNTQSYISYSNILSTALSKKKNFAKIDYRSLDAYKGWNLKDNKTISKIESTGIPFGHLYQTRHGIATLKNDIYIFRPVAEDTNYYYLQNGSLYKIEKGICKDILNSNKLSREVNFSKIKEKVIFPYSNENKPKLLQEEVIKENFPEAYKYLLNKRKILETRDKGNGNYENWFAFGRTQSLEKIKNKMFFPKYSDRTPNFLMNSDENLLFYNGLAVIGHSEREMLMLRKIMESSVFWYYIKMTSKPYSSSYYSLNGNYIKNFGIYPFSEDEVDYIISEKNKEVLDDFFISKYDVQLN